MLTDYTTYDDVRSALGVSSDELEDATLALESWESHLLFELEDVNADLGSTYLTVVSIAAGDRTAAQAKLYRATRLFSALATANALAASLPMFGPKDISDGKATMSRFADAPYKAVIKRVADQYEVARRRVADALAELSSTSASTTSRAYMGSTGLGADPVTGS